ncbi:hypothetical protein QII53_gp1 [ssRNA phage SRR6960803_3]|uniref:Uncharacterized protein n=1 Tax=ssRNA phage SRR6960803_3 TaxID=2786619 RepID=A0A8S5L0T4_9VIRU|nr:hypothetical protein QII53_gp1 [ssRNA phage SRR6960803_3]DAD50722.1 TPA_asm: hypothetical protein [ssRNA phage SRR6960803_3]
MNAYDHDIQPVLLGAWTHRGEPTRLAVDGDLCQLIALVSRVRAKVLPGRPGPSRLNQPIAVVELRFSVNGETIDSAEIDLRLDRGEDVELGRVVEPVTDASPPSQEPSKAATWAAVANAMIADAEARLGKGDGGVPGGGITQSPSHGGGLSDVLRD